MTSFIEPLNVFCPSNAAPPQKFGALNITAALGPFVMRHPEVKGSMEEFMMQHVLPEFTSSEPYMRAIVSLVLVPLFYYSRIGIGLRGTWNGREA